MSDIRNAPQTLGWEPLDSEHILACPRVPVPSVLHLLPERYIFAIQQNAPNACCHQTESLEVDAWYSTAAEQAKKTPDLYKFYCTSCERVHARFCVGGNHPTDPMKQDKRPFWEVR